MSRSITGAATRRVGRPRRRAGLAVAAATATAVGLSVLAGGGTALAGTAGAAGTASTASTAGPADT
ncbi:MAG TPA: hypothetical protein VIW71_00175, partial [Streptomyces sp.]